MVKQRVILRNKLAQYQEEKTCVTIPPKSIQTFSYSQENDLVDKFITELVFCKPAIMSCITDELESVSGKFIQKNDTDVTEYVGQAYSLVYHKRLTARVLLSDKTWYFQRTPCKLVQ